MMKIREAHKLSYRIVDALKRERQSRGISNYKIAKESEISNSALSTIDLHKRIPTIATLLIIADAIGVNLSDIIKEVENKK